MKYKTSVRRFVLDMVDTKKIPTASVIEFTGISKSTISRWQKNGIFDKPLKRSGTTLHEKIVPIIRSMLQAKTTWTHSTMLHELLNNGVKCSKRTLRYSLKKMKVTRKRLKKKKLSKNTTPETLAEYKRTWNNIYNDGNDIIFQDESHFSNGLLPLYGYTFANEPAYVNQPTSRTEAYTLNFAFSKTGNIFWKFYKGSNCISRMQWFVDHLPPTRILMDNHSIHKSVIMSVDKVFTPVCQPFANPVEIVFSKVKTLFRSINDKYRDELSIEEKVERAINSLVYEDLQNAMEFVNTYVQEKY